MAIITHIFLRNKGQNDEDLVKKFYFFYPPLTDKHKSGILYLDISIVNVKGVFA
jgi:hypothetical protein